MAYKDFENNLDKFLETFGINQTNDNLFGKVEGIEVPRWLEEFLERSTKLSLIKEKERSEFIVAPILLAGRELTDETFAIYSGHLLNADFNQDLNGECDFVLTKTKQLPSLTAPIITLVEAKNQDIIAGYGQCAAQMLGARTFNQKRNNEIETIFGCVTTGETWQWLKLENNDLIFDTNRFYISNVDLILGVFVEIVKFYETYPNVSNDPKSKIQN